MEENFRRYELDNGTVVLTEHMPWACTVGVGFWINYGSRHEKPGQHGSSHMIEHMIFKGTEDMNPMDIAVAFESVGASFNASASKESTNLYARVLDEHLPMAAKILSDMSLRSVFPESEFELEKQVILEEIQGHNDTPEDVAHDTFLSDTFGSHGLGHPILGTEESIGATTRDGLYSLYKEVYRPSRIVIAAAGNLEKYDIPALFTETLGSCDKAPIEDRMPPDTQKSVINIVQRDCFQAQVYMGFPGVPFDHPQRYALNALDMVLSGGMSSRLFQEVREKRGLVYDISSECTSYRDCGSFFIYAGMRLENMQEVLEITMKEILDVRAGNISADELERCKQQFRAAMIMSKESTTSRMSRLARNELYYGRYVADDEYINKFCSITVGDIVSAAEMIFRPDPVVFSALGPFDEKISSETRLKVLDVLGKL